MTGAELIREQLSQTEGVVVEVGDLAWAEHGKPWAKPGDYVIFAKFGGLMSTGKDGLAYRILNDLDIVAVLDPEVGNE